MRTQIVEDDPRNLMPVQFEVKTYVIDWLSLFVAHRAVILRNDEVVQGLLHPGLDGGHPLVRSALEEWDGTHFLHQTPAGTQVTLVRRIAPSPPERWWLHLVLALATLLTTSLAGAYFAGRAPLALTVYPLGSWGMPVPVALRPSEVLPGLAFSVPLMAILLGHELGHYLVARRRGMDVSPPYFIPAPNWLNFIGTFGAFIRLRSAVINRAVLLEVGAGGPLVSFALSVPALALGLLGSPALPASPDAPSRLVALYQGQAIWIGDSLLTWGLTSLLGAEGGVIHLSPLALAGWIGLFVTALNLFPLAQLDGGHILYALIGRAQRWAGVAFLLFLIALGRLWVGWWFWAAMILLLGRGSTRHPAVFDPIYPVEGRRRLAGWLCVAIFVLTFAPIPF